MFSTARNLYITSALVLGLATPATAWARKNEREGFNFGASFRLLDATESSQDNPDNPSKSKNSGQSISPHIGWAFDEMFNFGVALNFENKALLEKDKSKDGNLEISRDKQTSTKSAGVFGRFLFAKVLYFEAGIGMYEQRRATTNEYSAASGDDGSSYTVRKESFNTRGLGLGYNAGIGLEVPAAAGFYITSALVQRSYSLRDYSGGSSLGDGKQKISTKEISFGISHYVN